MTSYTAEFDDMPGTRVFTAQRAKNGYELNQFCMSLMKEANRERFKADEVARKYGVPRATTSLDEVLASDDVDAVILCTPTQLHASQAAAAMRAGKNVQGEIPVADSWADAQ